MANYFSAVFAFLGMATLGSSLSNADAAGVNGNALLHETHLNSGQVKIFEDFSHQAEKEWPEYSSGHALAEKAPMLELVELLMSSGKALAEANHFLEPTEQDNATDTDLGSTEAKALEETKWLTSAIERGTTLALEDQDAKSNGNWRESSWLCTTGDCENSNLDSPQFNFERWPADVDFFPELKTKMERLLKTFRNKVTGDCGKENNGPCDKCDGAHATQDCPHYPNEREEHEDAHSGYSGPNNPEGSCEEWTGGQPFYERMNPKEFFNLPLLNYATNLKNPSFLDMPPVHTTVHDAISSVQAVYESKPFVMEKSRPEQLNNTIWGEYEEKSQDIKDRPKTDVLGKGQLQVEIRDTLKSRLANDIKQSVEQHEGMITKIKERLLVVNGTAAGVAKSIKEKHVSVSGTAGEEPSGIISSVMHRIVGSPTTKKNPAGITTAIQWFIETVGTPFQVNVSDAEENLEKKTIAFFDACGTADNTFEEKISKSEEEATKYTDLAKQHLAGHAGPKGRSVLDLLPDSISALKKQSAAVRRKVNLIHRKTGFNNFCTESKGKSQAAAASLKRAGTFTAELIEFLRSFDAANEKLKESLIGRCNEWLEETTDSLIQVKAVKEAVVRRLYEDYHKLQVCNSENRLENRRRKKDAATLDYENEARNVLVEDDEGVKYFKEIEAAKEKAEKMLIAEEKKYEEREQVRDAFKTDNDYDGLVNFLEENKVNFPKIETRNCHKTNWATKVERAQQTLNALLLEQAKDSGTA